MAGRRRHGGRMRLAFLGFFAFFAVLPILYTLLHSFSGGSSYTLFPSPLSLQGYYQVFLRQPDYLIQFWNSMLLASAIAAGQTAVSCLAGYALSKFRFPGREAFFFFVIVLMMMPAQVTLVSGYVVLDAMGLLDTMAALILPGCFSPFGVFLLRQVFDTCPDEMLEAARLDGAGYLRVLFRVLVPRSRAGVGSLVLLTFIDAWNMVEQPLVYLRDPYDYPLSIFLSRMEGDNIGVLCTCGVLAAVPVLLLFFYYDEDLGEGIALSQLY